MLNNKTIKQIGTILKIKNSSLIILSTLKIENNEITLHNLDTIVKIKTNISGTFLADYNLFSNSLCITNSKTTDFSLDKFPGVPEITDKIEIDSQLFASSFKNYIGYAASNNDPSRPVLQNINFKSDFGVWCTDGHRGIINTNLIPSFNFSVRQETILIHSILLSSNEQIENVYLANKDNDIADTDFTCNYKYIICETKNCTIISKLYIDSPLPNIKKAIPDLSVQYKTYLSASEISILKSAVELLTPYTNEKTHLIRALGNKLYVLNRDTKKQFSIKLPFNFTPEYYIENNVINYFHLTGFNAVYLSNILNNISTDCTIHFKTSISPVYFRCENKIDYFIMPLRIIEDDSKDETVIPYYENIELPTQKKSTPIKNSSYYLYESNKLYGISSNKNHPYKIKQLTEKEFNILKKIGVNVTSEGGNNLSS